MEPIDARELTADPVVDLLVSVADAARVVFSAGGVTETLARVVELAVSTIEGCDVAGLCVVEQDAIATAVYTDPIVAELEAIQHQLGEGPCLESIDEGRIAYAPDIIDATQWPALGAEMHAAGMRGVLALPLATTSRRGSLNLYARFPAAFGVIDRARAVILGSLAGHALSVARSHEDEVRLVDDLHDALASRQVIGQAEGILMERERVTSNQAFDILRRASQHLNRKLRDVAEDLVDTGERPETGSSRGGRAGD